MRAVEIKATEFLDIVLVNIIIPGEQSLQALNYPTVIKPAGSADY